MKRIIALAMTLALMLSCLVIQASALKTTSDKIGNVLDLAWGSAKIDGELDDAYLKSSKNVSYVYNTYNQLATDGYPAGQESSFYSYIIWDGDYFYVYTEAFDKTPVDANKVTSYDHKTDSIEFYFILVDWDTTMKWDVLDVPGTAMFRVHPAYVKCPTCAEDLSAHLGTKGSMAIALYSGEIKQELVIKDTATGYKVEFKLEIPKDVKAKLAAGQIVGYGLQMNDDVDGDNTRDALLWSECGYGDDHGKTAKYKLLAQDAVPATTATTAAATTAAVTTATTKAAATTTKAAATTVTTKAAATTATTKAATTAPATLDPVLMSAAVAVSASTLCVVLAKKKKSR